MLDFLFISKIDFVSITDFFRYFYYMFLQNQLTYGNLRDLSTLAFMVAKTISIGWSSGGLNGMPWRDNNLSISIQFLFYCIRKICRNQLTRSRYWDLSQKINPMKASLLLTLTYPTPDKAFTNSCHFDLSETTLSWL